MSTPPGGRGRVRARPWWSWIVVVTVTATLLTAGIFDVVLRRRGRADLVLIGFDDVAMVVALLTCALVGVALMRQRPEHPVGWCFAALALVLCLNALTSVYATWGLWIEPSSLRSPLVVAAIDTALWVPWMPLFALIWSLTPDGHHLSARWRWANIVLIAASGLWFVHGLAAPGRLDPPYGEFDNSLAASWFQPWLQDGLSVVCISLVAAALGSLVVRFHRASGDDRRQLTWMAVIAVPFTTLIAASAVAAITGHQQLAQTLAAGFIALPPLGVWLSVTRARLYDVDRILSRTVGYLLASLALVGLFAVTIVIVARALGEAASRSPAASAVASLVAVVAARPLYTTLQDSVDRRFERQRHAAIARVTSALDPPAGPPIEQVLRDVLDDHDLTIRFPLVGSDRWIDADGGVVAIDTGFVTIEREGQTVAAVSHRHPDDGRSSSVIRAAIPAMERAGLRATIANHTREIAESRRRLADAHDAERSRIERDLHDGAQARLLGVAAHLQAALLNGATDQMRAGLTLGIEECRGAVADLRALANGLRPATLDAGLNVALDELVARFSARLEIDTRHARFATASELTIWFVACEALTNAAKHGGPGTTMVVRLAERGAWLDLVVDDDGCGGADPNGRGVRGLADRVAAVGGRLDVLDLAPRGTRVQAVVPCAS